MKKPMEAESSNGRRTFAQVRRVYWLVLAGALLLALLLPAATLWHAATSTLQARACVVPAMPRAGQAAWIVVAPTNATDRTAVDGPWAQVITRWDMVTMQMGPLHQRIPGSRANDGAFAIPLQLNMAGQWWAQIALSTPGRPSWQQTVEFSVLPMATGGHALAPESVSVRSCGSAGDVVQAAAAAQDTPVARALSSRRVGRRSVRL
ncbi:MAG: hypothetical protein ACHQ4H_04360 [Ktedonobacterales bacterium]